jgi:hypothetical protein
MFEDRNEATAQLDYTYVKIAAISVGLNEQTRKHF